MTVYYSLRKERDFDKVAFCLRFSDTDDEFLAMIELFGLDVETAKALTQ